MGPTVYRQRLDEEILHINNLPYIQGRARINEYHCTCMSKTYPHDSETAIYRGHSKCLYEILTSRDRVSPNAYYIVIKNNDLDMFMMLSSHIRMTFHTLTDTVEWCRLDMFKHVLKCMSHTVPREQIIAGILTRCKRPYHRHFLQYLIGKGVLTSLDIIDFVQYITRFNDNTWVNREVAVKRWRYLSFKKHEIDTYRVRLLYFLGIVLRRNFAFHMAVTNWRKRRSQRRITAAIIIQRAFRNFYYRPGGLGAILCRADWDTNVCQH